jgi:hypothetical protein
VTVGIAVLAESADMVILGTDLRATFPKLKSSNDECGKMWDLPAPFDCAVAVAGILRDCQPFVDQLYTNLRKLRELANIYNEHVENAMDEARFLVFRRRADWAMRTSYCITLSQWLRGKVPLGKLDPLTLKAGEVLIHNTPLRVEAILAGFVKGNPFFCKVSGKRVLEYSATPGIAVIGTGGSLAMDHLNKRGQNSGCSIARSLLHVAEALDEAAKESQKTVGRPSRFIAIHRDGSMAQFFPDHPTLLGWKQAYANRDSTWSLQNSKISEIQAKGMARRHWRKN